MASEGPKNTVAPGRGPRGWPGRRGLRVTPRTALCRPPACGWIRARPLARGPACRPAGLQGQAAQAPPLRVSTQPPALPLGGGLRVSLGVTRSLQGEQGAGKGIAGERAPVTSGYPRGRRAPAEQPLSAQGAPSAGQGPGRDRPRGQGSRWTLASPCQPRRRRQRADRKRGCRPPAPGPVPPSPSSATPAPLCTWLRPSRVICQCGFFPGCSLDLAGGERVGHLRRFSGRSPPPVPSLLPQGS